jgi:hypothetical protein
MRLYHWTTAERALKVFATDTFTQRRWKHFLEKESRFAQGTSWGLDDVRWQADHTVCFVIDTTHLLNNLHSVNGERTYLLTKAMINPVFDPNAYKYESTEVDEIFIEGAIENFGTFLVDIEIKPTCDVEYRRALLSSVAVKKQERYTLLDLDAFCIYNLSAN